LVSLGDQMVVPARWHYRIPCSLYVNGTVAQILSHPISALLLPQALGADTETLARCGKGPAN
jgi:hypothetical protein